VSEAEDEPSRACVSTFKPTAFVAVPDDGVAAAGSCAFDHAPGATRQLAVLRWLPQGSGTRSGAADEVARTLGVVVEPLPGTGRDDRVTGLVARSRDELVVGVTARGSAAPARLLTRARGGVWTSARTPLRGPAIAIAAAPAREGAETVLWIASPSEVWRWPGAEVWERVPLPAPDAMKVVGTPELSSLWVAAADDVWVVAEHGRRVLRTKPAPSVVALGNGAP
jgi:hypothetical protein